MLKDQTTHRTSHVRIWILCLILFLSVVAYADRSILSISGSAIKEEFGLSAIQLGLILSAFSWAYVIGQIPGGLFLDRFGAKKCMASRWRSGQSRRWRWDSLVSSPAA